MNRRRASADAPARLLARAVRFLPPGCAEWGQAMLTELAHIDGRRARWRFALGCIRVALLPPREAALLQTVPHKGDLMAPHLERSRPATAAWAGSLLLLPFVIANAIVANRIEPFFSLIRPGAHTSPREFVLLAVVLLLMPLGAFVAARPLLARDATGRRRVYPLNAALAGLFLAAFLAIASGLGTDIYRCEILGIANCD